MQQTTVKHNPLTFYLRSLLYMFIALMLRVLALVPLCALFAFPAESPWRWLALLCPVLLIFLVLPLRYSLAEALVQKPRQRCFSFDTALNLNRYGEKLGESLLHAVNVLKWAIPLLILAGYAYYCKNNMDAKMLLAAMTNLGKNATSLWYSVANFFITLFGGTAMPVVNGSVMQGVYVVLGIVGVALLVLLYGMLRNSCNRYIWVLANRSERNPRTEIRRRMRGRRMRQLLVGLVNLLLWAPFLVVVGMILKDVMGTTLTQLMMMVGYNGGSALDVGKALSPLLLAFLLLYMPLLPARRIITAAFAAHAIRHTAPEQAAPAVAAVPAAETAANDTDPMPAAYVPQWVKEANQNPENRNGASMG